MRKGLLLSLIFAAFIITGLRIYTALSIPEDDVSHWQGQQVTVAGVIEGEPRISQDKMGVNHIRYVLRVIDITADGVKKTARGKIAVYSKEMVQRETKVHHGRSGDVLKVSGKVRLPHDYQNPGRIDWVMSQRSQGITAYLLGNHGDMQVMCQEGDWLLRRAGDVRQFYRDLMESAMPAEDAAAVFAMLFGGYNGIKEELIEAFTLTGIIHILSVSGSHITLLSGTVGSLGRLFHIPAKITAVAAAIIIIAYSLLAGAVPPVIRSAAMGAVTLFATLYGRERESLYILSLIAVSMLMYSPLIIYDISFQLSFGATAGILGISPVLRGVFQQVHCGRYRLPAFVTESFSVTIGAQLSILPLLAWYFNVISITSLLANLVVVPLVEWIIIMGLLAGLAGCVLPFAGKIVFAAASIVLGTVYEITKIIAALPGSRIYLPTMGIKTTILYYLILVISIQNEKIKNKIYGWGKRYGFQLTACCLICVVISLCCHMVRPGELHVHFIDCGQGDSCLVITPGGHSFMVDVGGSRGGGFDVGKRVDVPYLLHYGVTKLDCIFLTHAHEDHAAGVAGIVEQIPVGAIMVGHEGKREYQKTFGDKKHVVQENLLAVVQEGRTYEIDGVKVEVLYSPTAEQAISLGNATGNEFSNLFRISYGAASFLITGDLVKEQERVLLDNNKNVKSTVLKVGHHGSRTSSSPEWLRAVNPRYSVISCGYENSFGHPHKEILQALEDNTTSKVLRTDVHGAIIFKTDGKKINVQCFNE